MNTPEFPIETTIPGRAQLPAHDEPRRLRRYAADSGIAGQGSPSYDSLLDYWQILRRHKLKLLIFALASLSGALLISLVQTPIYRVRTSLEIQSANLTELKGESGSAGGTYASPESYMETQVRLLQSESLIERVIEKMKLHQRRPTGTWGTLRSSVQHIFDWPARNPLPEREQLIRQIGRNLTVRSSGNSRLLEVFYESPNPEQAADFANTLVGEFIELNQEQRWKAAQRAADWFTNHLDQMKGQLETSEAQLQEYARASRLSYTEERESLAEAHLKELQQELSKVQAERIGHQARYEESRRKAQEALPEILEDATMREYRQKLTDLQRQHAELSATLTPAHYRVQRLQAQIDELRAQMAAERANVLGRIANEYAASVRREKLVTQAHAEQEKVVADESAKAIHYGTLKRNVDSNRRLYETTLQRVKEASVAAAMRDSNVIVIDRAKSPLLPYRPTIFVNLAIGLSSGVFLGFAFVLLRERFDHRIVAPGDAQIYLELPELGAIPIDETSHEFHGNHLLYRRRSSSPLAVVATEPKEDGPELATWRRKPSLIAECTRTTLTSILFANQQANQPQVVVLTSPCLGDGKTTVACNLSVAIAEIGRKVLLIDGDLRRPRLHKVFGLKNTRGLSDLLSNNTLPNDTLSLAVVQQTEVAGLSILAGGSCQVPPTNLFYSPKMSELLTRLRREFDMILIDAPPTIHLADARVLGKQADGVILIFRAGQTTTEGARVAIQRFNEDGTRVLGTVLNSWDPRASALYGYGRYGVQ